MVDKFWRWMFPGEGPLWIFWFVFTLVFCGQVAILNVMPEEAFKGDLVAFWGILMLVICFFPAVFSMMWVEDKAIKRHDDEQSLVR